MNVEYSNTHKSIQTYIRKEATYKDAILINY